MFVVASGLVRSASTSSERHNVPEYRGTCVPGVPCYKLGVIDVVEGGLALVELVDGGFPIGAGSFAKGRATRLFLAAAR